MAANKDNRRASALSQGLLYSVIVIAILVVINFFANRYNKSYDSTSSKKFTLSDQTIKIANTWTIRKSLSGNPAHPPLR